MEVTYLELKGMGCAACANKIQKAIENVAGVAECQVNFAIAQATVKYNSHKTNLHDILNSVTNIGFEAQLIQETINFSDKDREDRRIERQMTNKVIFGGRLAEYKY